MWCSLVGRVVAILRALSSTRATDVRGVTERCFFDRRRGCSFGSRGSRRCSSTSSECSGQAEAEVVSK